MDTALDIHYAFRPSLRYIMTHYVLLAFHFRCFMNDLA